MIVLKILCVTLSVIVLVTSFLPLFRLDHWVFRATEYPGIQKVSLSIACLLGLIVLYSYYNHWILIIDTLLLISIILHLSVIWPYTLFAKKEMREAENQDKENQLSLLIGNVYQPNIEYQKTIDQIRENDPDMFIFVEVNQEWNKQLDTLTESYPYTILVPLENMYGMVLYSKFPLKNRNIQYLVKDDIPSIKCTTELPSGKEILTYFIHPEPPSPSESSYSTNKDKELMKVAEEVAESNQAAIVAGDLNDVAWSSTTKLFQKMSSLLDPRKGRGFYNTFHAKYKFLRFPLDHIFCSEEFELVQMRRLPPCGSDHFHILSVLQYSGNAVDQDAPDPSEEEKNIATEKKKAEPTEN